MSEDPPSQLIRLGEHEAPENCRFYEQKYPELEEFVMVRVTSITDTAAYVQLLEYNKIEGMIPLTELSRRRIRSVNKHIRVGKTEVVQVFRLDREKGYIDLSKKKVTDDDLRPCEARYNKAKDVHSIMQHVARECRVQLESLYKVVGWPLYKRFQHANDAFAIAFHDPEKIFSLFNLPEDVREKFITTIRHRHKSQPFRIRSDVEVNCFKYEGIDAIREALRCGEQLSDDKDIGITIRLLAAPTYVIVANALDKEEGLAAVAKAIEAIRVCIVTKGGTLKVTKAPAVVSNEEELSKRGGDESSDDEEEEDESTDEEDEEDDEDDKGGDDDEGGDE